MKKVLLYIAIFFIIKYIVDIHFKGNKMIPKNFTIQDGKNAIQTVKNKYGVDMAKRVEQMMRLETTHFTSKQYRLTGSAGMEVGKWSNIPTGATEGFIEMDDIHKPGIEKFIVWKSPTDFALYLAEYIKRYNGNFSRWNALDPTLQKEYAVKVNSVTPKFV